MSFLNLNDNIVRFRKERKITQEELAEFAGVTKGSVSKWNTAIYRNGLKSVLHRFTRK